MTEERGVRRRWLPAALALLLGAAALFALSGPARLRPGAGWRPASEREERGPRAAPHAVAAVASPGPATSGPEAGRVATPVQAGAREQGSAPGAASSPDGSGADRLPPARGRVVEAGTGRPIPGAWVTWRPVPSGVADRVLLDPAFLEVGEGLFSDAQGEFALERLPPDLEPSATLHAVAAGWAPGSAPARLRGRAEIALVPAGGLRLRLRGPARQVALTGPGEPVTDPLEVMKLQPRLAPGEWSVWVDGAELARARVQPGRVTELELEAPAWVPLRGQLGPVACPGPLRLVFLRGEAAFNCPVGADGRFELELPPGRWEVLLCGQGDQVQQPLAPLEVGPGAPPVRLAVPELVAFELRFAEAPGVVEVLGLGVPGRFAPGLPVDGPGPSPRRLGMARPGRHLLLVDGLPAGELELPAGQPLELDPRPFAVELRWRAAGLEPGERVHGTARLVPPALAGSPLLGAVAPVQLEDGAGRAVIQLLWPGTYLLEVASDLGALRRELTLTGPTTVEVDLPTE